MTDISVFDFNGGSRSTSEKTTNDVAFAKFLVAKVGVAVVPGSSFYGNPSDGSSQVRFTFCKKESTLAAAEERLARLPQHLADFRAHA
jgi:aminotransferase